MEDTAWARPAPGQGGDGSKWVSRCSEIDGHEFCVWCPCPIPPCCPGHSGDKDVEWHCSDCHPRSPCACWDAAMRSNCGWDEAQRRWARNRELKEAVIARMQARAAANADSLGIASAADEVVNP